LDGVGFSGAQLTVLAAAFGPLLTAIGILFRALVASKDQQIKSCAATLEEALATNRDLSKAVVEATAELRELRADLWRERGIGGQQRGSR
jgi:hypothetical protein